MTPVTEQSAVRVFADKAVGYGVPGITIDGTDPEAIAAAFVDELELAGHDVVVGHDMRESSPSFAAAFAK